MNSNRKTILRYLFGKPESLEDYILIRGKYISKMLLIRIGTVLLFVGLGILILKEPLLKKESPFEKIDSNDIVINTPEFHRADGDVEVYSTDGSLLYQGTMKQGRITGSGKLYLEEKLLYEGQFKEEQFEGKGTLYQDEKVQYEGMFSKNEYNGSGILYSKTGLPLLKGTFVDGELIQGTEYDNFGKIKYKGEFKQKDYHGKGEIYENGDRKSVV